MSRSSASLSPRKSLVSPTFQPARSSAFRLVVSMITLLPLGRLVVCPEPFLARADDMLRRLVCSLIENFPDHDCVNIQPVDDSPSLLLISHPQFMATDTDTWHRP